MLSGIAIILLALSNLINTYRTDKLEERVKELEKCQKQTNP